MTIPAFIMAVPWNPQRAKRAMQIHKATDGKIVWDEQQNAMHTFTLVLQAMIDAGDNGSIIIQDDVELADNWRLQVEHVIAEHSDKVVQFFSMGKDDLEKTSGERAGQTFISNLCVYYPPGLAAELLAFLPEFLERWPQFKTGDDFVVRYWLWKKAKTTFWMHMPSLVQHEPWVSSIHPKRPRNRRSKTFFPGTPTIPSPAPGEGCER